MSYGEVRTEHGASAAVEPGEGSDFLMLRTFSTVKQGMMASFMNALTWQAAWLRHCFRWDRVVVGYALTDVPERVMELYAVPISLKEIARAREILERLHVQPEYKQLAECCVEIRQEVEELIPAMGLDTRLKHFINERRKEHGLVEQGRGAEENLQQLQAKFEGAVRKERELIANINRVDLVLKDLNQRLDRLDRMEKDMPEARVLDTVEGLKKLITKNVAQRARYEDELKVVRQEKSGLESQQAQARQAVKEAQKAIQDAQDPEKRRDKFKDVIKIPAYFLVVLLKVNPGSWDKFEEGMEKLARHFKWDFVAAGRHLLEPGKTDLVSDEVMNLWTFNDANDLYRQMIELRESQPFAALDALTTDEKQMLMCDWEALSRTKRAPSLQQL
jgi:hypothetical protein